MTGAGAQADLFAAGILTEGAASLATTACRRSRPRAAARATTLAVEAALGRDRLGGTDLLIDIEASWLAMSARGFDDDDGQGIREGGAAPARTPADFEMNMRAEDIVNVL